MHPNFVGDALMRPANRRERIYPFRNIICETLYCATQILYGTDKCVPYEYECILNEE